MTGGGPGYYRLPVLRRDALAVWRRNVLVWRKLIGPSLLMNFGEPFIYLMGLGLGLGLFIGQMSGLSYLTFLASGIVASSAMNTASFEGMYSVYTRMVPQRTYDSMLATPLDVDDIIAGEMLWCATKGAVGEQQSHQIDGPRGNAAGRRSSPLRGAGGASGVSDRIVLCGPRHGDDCLFPGL